MQKVISSVGKANNTLPEPFEGEIGGVPCKVVDARSLYEYLDAGRQFTDWVQHRIKHYGFLENVDYSSFHKIVKSERGAATRREYHLSMDMAKEMCMLQNNSLGREARRYLIDRDKKMAVLERVAASTGQDVFDFVSQPAAAVSAADGQQLSLWAMEPLENVRMRDLLVDVALQAKAGSKLAQFLRMVKPLVLGGKGGGGL